MSYWLIALVIFIVLLFSRSKVTTGESKYGELVHDRYGVRVICSFVYSVVWPITILTFVIFLLYSYMMPFYIKLDNWIHKDNKV